jgi:hypothetical protein
MCSGAHPLILSERQPFQGNIAMTARMLDPRSDRATSQNPLNGRLVCEWKQTAEKRMTCTWALREATPARLPDLSPEDSASELENCAHSFEDRIPMAGQDRFLVWIWQPPRRVRTILGMAAAVVFLGLATADLSRSTTANSRQTGHVSMATTVARSAMVDNVQAPVIDPNIEFFLGAADGSAGAWIRPPTLRP